LWGKRKKQRPQSQPKSESEPNAASEFFADQYPMLPYDLCRTDPDTAAAQVGAQSAQDVPHDLSQLDDTQQQMRISQTSIVDEPVQSQPREHGMQLQQTTQIEANGDDANASTALQRAIQSSPARFLGSQESPIDLDTGLTPRPTRRQLFPSPRKEGEFRSLEDGLPPQMACMARSPISDSDLDPALFQNTTAQMQPASVAVTAFVNITTVEEAEEVDKENLPPPADSDDEFAHLFNSDSPLLRTTSRKRATPTSHGSNENINSSDYLLKTPTPASRKALTPRSARRSADKPHTTPSRSGPGTGMGLTAPAPMTPFTAQMNQLFSDGIGSSPSRLFNFSDLPTFTTPERNGGGGFDFGDLGRFSGDGLFGTELPGSASCGGGAEGGSGEGVGFRLYEDPPEGQREAEGLLNSDMFADE